MQNHMVKPLIQGVRFIQAALLDFKRGFSVDEIVSNECAKYRGKPNIMGYARPLAKGDERVVAMERVSGSLACQTACICNWPSKLKHLAE